MTTTTTKDKDFQTALGRARLQSRIEDMHYRKNREKIAQLRTEIKKFFTSLPVTERGDTCTMPGLNGRVGFPANGDLVTYTGEAEWAYGEWFLTAIPWNNTAAVVSIGLRNV